MTNSVQLTCVGFVSQLSNNLLISAFQSESEQDEECTGSMGSAAVAVSLFFIIIFYYFLLT